MELLVMVPVINIVIFIVACAISAMRHGDKRYTHYTPTMTTDNPPTPVETYTMQHEYPDISDQLDGRLTNIVKNPMKGVL